VKLKHKSAIVTTLVLPCWWTWKYINWKPRNSLLKAFNQLIPLACCQLSADWKHTFYVCLRCSSWQ